MRISKNKEMIVKSLTNVFWKIAAVFGGVDKRGVKTGRSALFRCLRRMIFLPDRPEK